MAKVKVDMVEVDRTVHDIEQHRTPGVEFNDDGTFVSSWAKTKAWYANWGNKCPTCKAPAKIVMEPVNG